MSVLTRVGPRGFGMCTTSDCAFWSAVTKGMFGRRMRKSRHGRCVADSDGGCPKLRPELEGCMFIERKGWRGILRKLNKMDMEGL